MRPNGPALVLADKLKIGVAVVNATTKEITHDFEQLKVDRR